MENNLNYKGIDKYAKQAAELLLEKAYADKQTLTGKELLEELSPIRQVNLFVIKNIYFKWQSEASKLESPYFDYSNKEVEEALKNFLNLLSRHIAVGKEALEEVLVKSIKEALLLIFTPYDFYTHQFESNDQLSLADLQTYSKYIKVNKNIMNGLLKQLENAGASTLTIENLVHHLNEVFENTDASPEEIETYLSDFNEIAPLTAETIYGKIDSTKEPDNSEEPVKAVVDEEKKILNDELANDQKETLADQLQKQKIKSIEKHLSINQRYMFVRTLFDGDEELFKATIEHLETMDSESAAIDYINQEFTDWDHESDEVDEFKEILAKRLG